MNEIEPQVPMDSLTIRILRDVHGGQVELLPDDVYLIPEDVLPPDREGYRLRVLSMRIFAYVMPAADSTRLQLSSTGEYLWRASNPKRYESQHAIEVRDGQYQSTAVTA